MKVVFDVIHKGRVVDRRKLLQAVLDGRALPAWIRIDQGELNRFALRTRGRIRVPGVQWYEERMVRFV